MIPVRYERHLLIKSTVILITELGGPKGCAILRIPHILDNRLTVGGQVVSLTNRPHSKARKQFLFLSLLLISLKG
jgi:hypothetical protein